MLALPTMETAILDRAHLVGIAAPEHLIHEPIIVARIIARIDTFEPVPVIDKDLCEDIPVPRGFCNHQGAPSWGVVIVAVPLFYHASPASSTPSHPSPAHPHPPSHPGATGTSGHPTNANSFYVAAVVKPSCLFFLPCILWVVCHIVPLQRGERQPEPDDVTA